MGAREEAQRPDTPQQVRGYGQGGVETVISVEDVNRQAAALATGGISESRLAELVGATPFVEIAGLRAGYGKMQILHEFSLQIGQGPAPIGTAACRERGGQAG